MFKFMSPVDSDYLETVVGHQNSNSPLSSLMVEPDSVQSILADTEIKEVPTDCQQRSKKGQRKPVVCKSKKRKQSSKENVLAVASSKRQRKSAA
jgi:hypothetical protein